jgi:aminoglycoside phosphotransferase (APT) family kinase protein
MVSPAPHGYDLTPADRRLLRGPPPPRALAWCAAAFGPGARAERVAALEGGTSSAVHAVDVVDAGGRVHPLVLRRFVRADWLAVEPDLARREAAALALLAGSDVPAPALVAVDPDGPAAGAPAVLMTRLAGTVRWRPADLEPYLRALAAALPAIHAVAVPAAAGLPAYRPYALEVDRPPAWTRRPALWWRAFAAFHGPPPSAERRLVHRDYHPGNVLWSDGAPTGIVDWVNASAGPPGADLGHCRMNLARAVGLDAADRFSAIHRSVSWRDDEHPYWDLVAAIGGFAEADFARWTPRAEDFLAQAVERL